MPRSLKVLIIVGALVVALVPVAAVAGHQFTDVPSNHTFHADISWLADNGITKGCNPPANTKFCPDSPVTRGQMAAFMHRFYNRLVPGPWGVGYRWNRTPHHGNGVAVETTLTIDQPGLLHLWASSDVSNAIDSDLLYCGINTGSTTDNAQLDSWRPIDLTTNVADTCSTQTALRVTPGTQIVRLVISRALSSTETAVEGANIIAILAPDDGSAGPLSRPKLLQVPAPEASDEAKKTD